jgi:hypothetical protein
LSKQKKYFSPLHFDEILMLQFVIFSSQRINAPKIREIVVVDKKNPYVIYEWSLSTTSTPSKRISHAHCGAS